MSEKCSHCGKIIEKKDAIITARKNNEVFCSDKCLRSRVLSLWLEPWEEKEGKANE